MNRWRLPKPNHWGNGPSSPLGTLLGLLLGAATLLVVGSALGRGLDPPPGGADAVAIRTGSNGALGASESLRGVVGAALRGLGAAPSGVEVVQASGPDVRVVPEEVALEIAVEPEGSDVDGAPPEEEDLRPGRRILLVAFTASETFAPLDVDVDGPADGPVARGDDISASPTPPGPEQPSAAVTRSEPVPPIPQPTPRRTPVRTSGQAVPTPVATQAIAHPSSTATQPTPTRRPRTSPTPKPTIAVAQTRVPTPASTAVRTEGEREDSRRLDRERRQDD
jgi:hypothetical protein